MQLCDSLAVFRANETTEAHLRWVLQENTSQGDDKEDTTQVVQALCATLTERPCLETETVACLVSELCDVVCREQGAWQCQRLLLNEVSAVIGWTEVIQKSQVVGKQLLDTLVVLLECDSTVEEESRLGALLDRLVDFIMQATPQCAQAMHALSLLTRSSEQAKERMRQRGERELYMELVRQVTSSDTETVLAALSCLAALAMRDNVGIKMFSGNNLPQAVALGIRGVAQWQRRPRRAMMGAQLLSDLFGTDFIGADLVQTAVQPLVSAINGSPSEPITRELCAALDTALNNDAENVTVKNFHQVMRQLDASQCIQLHAVLAQSWTLPVRSWASAARALHILLETARARELHVDTDLLLTAVKACEAALKCTGLEKMEEEGMQVFLLHALCILLTGPRSDEAQEHVSDLVACALSMHLVDSRAGVLRSVVQVMAQRPTDIHRMASALRQSQKETKTGLEPAANLGKTASWRKNGGIGVALNMDEMQATITHLELEAELKAVEGERTQSRLREMETRVRELETASRDLSEMRVKHNEQGDRLQSALEKLVHQAGEAKKRIHEQVSLSQKCQDLRDANERLVAQLGELRKSEELSRQELSEKLEASLLERDGLLQRTSQLQEQLQKEADAMAELKAEEDRLLAHNMRLEAQAAKQQEQLRKYVKIEQFMTSITSLADEGLGEGSA